MLIESDYVIHAEFLVREDVLASEAGPLLFKRKEIAKSFRLIIAVLIMTERT
jgi:hypothetical protein